MTCPHITATAREYNVCALGLYGGRPSHGTCLRCTQRGENTAEFAAALHARAERTPPAGAPAVSGCCDSALNPPTRFLKGSEI